MRFNEFKIDETVISEIPDDGNRGEFDKPEEPEDNNAAKTNPLLKQFINTMFMGLFGMVLSKVAGKSPEFAQILRTILSGNTSGFDPNKVISMAPPQFRSRVQDALSRVDPKTGDIIPDGLDNSGRLGNITINRSMDPLFSLDGSQSRMTSRSAATNMRNTLEKYRTMVGMLDFEVPINDAIAKAGTSRESETKGSQHFQGTALDLSVARLNDKQKIQLFQAALRAGFTGFGFGQSILHVDTGPMRHWSYNNSSYGGYSISSLGQHMRKYATA